MNSYNSKTKPQYIYFMDLFKLKALMIHRNTPLAGFAASVGHVISERL